MAGEKPVIKSVHEINATESHLREVEVGQEINGEVVYKIEIADINTRGTVFNAFVNDEQLIAQFEYAYPFIIYSREKEDRDRRNVLQGGVNEQDD